MKNLIVFIGLAFSIVGIGQEEVLVPKTNKGKIFFYWGWNRGYFSNSDIHFSGEGYDFVLEDVKANDRQTRFALDPIFIRCGLPYHKPILKLAISFMKSTIYHLV